MTTSGPTCATSPLRTEYVYDDGHLIGEYAPNLIDHTEILWLANTPIAVLKRRPGSTDGGPVGGGTSTPWTGMQAGGVDIYFIHPDHLDSRRAVVNANDQLIWLWNSAPFGDTAANEQPTVGLASFTFNLRFPGQQYDRETGTHYNYFRDYEAQTGRYVQSDPIGLWEGWNTYAYVQSQPFQYADLLGLGFTVTSVRTGRVVHSDPTHKFPCPTGSSNAKGKAGKAEMIRLINSNSIPRIRGVAVANTRNNVSPPPGRFGRARTDAVINRRGRPSIGLEAKCGSCAGPTKNQNQNYKPAVSPGRGGRRQFSDIFIFKFTP